MAPRLVEHRVIVVDVSVDSVKCQLRSKLLLPLNGHFGEIFQLPFANFVFGQNGESANDERWYHAPATVCLASSPSTDCLSFVTTFESKVVFFCCFGFAVGFVDFESRICRRFWSQLDWRHHFPTLDRSPHKATRTK